MREEVEVEVEVVEGTFQPLLTMAHSPQGMAEGALGMP